MGETHALMQSMFWSGLVMLAVPGLVLAAAIATFVRSRRHVGWGGGGGGGGGNDTSPVE